MRLTHRGPIVDQDILGGAQTLFSEGLPTIDSIIYYKLNYSLAWTGLMPIDDTVGHLAKLAHIKSTNDIDKMIEGAGEYRSIPQNLIVAFDNGDIAYYLMASAPKRKQDIPYIGCYVLDGTTSDNDWIGLQ